MFISIYFLYLCYKKRETNLTKNNKKMKKENRVYYITCKINGLKEEFRFKNKKVMQDYLANKGQMLRLSNVSNVECYSQIEK